MVSKKFIVIKQDSRIFKEIQKYSTPNKVILTMSYTQTYCHASSPSNKTKLELIQVLELADKDINSYLTEPYL